MLADLILIAILILNILFGLRRGFFEMLGRLALFLLSLAATLLMLGPLTDLLAGAPFLAPLADKLGQTVLQPLEATAASVGSAVEGFGLPAMLAQLMRADLPSTDSSVSQANPEFTAVLFKFALSAVIFILMFALAAILIHFLARSLTRATEHVPLLGAANRLGGLLAGLAVGLLQVSVILLVLGFLAPYVPFFAHTIADSVLARYFYSINILAFLL